MKRGIEVKRAVVVECESAWFAAASCMGNHAGRTLRVMNGQ